MPSAGWMKKIVENNSCIRVDLALGYGQFFDSGLRRDAGISPPQ